MAHPPDRHPPPEPIEAAPYRSRLIVRARRSAVVVLVLLLAAGAVLSWLAAGAVGRRVIDDSVDPRLDRALEAAATSSATTPVEEIRFRGRVDVVDGRIEPAGAAVDASPVADVVRDAAASGATVERDATVDDRPVRVRARPLATDGDVTPVFIGVADVHPDAAGRMVVVLAVAQLAALLALCGAAYLVARRSTQVVEDVFRHEDRLMVAVAHEIRSPLSRILAALEEGIDGVIPSDAALREAAGDAEDMSELIDDLVESARVMAGAIPLAQETVRLDEVAASGARAGARGASQVALDARTVKVVGSPGLLRVSISNLVRNAVRHGCPDGVGRVTVRVDDGGVSVTDDGPGIPAERLAALRRDVPRGLRRADAGLGLPLAAWVADIHGGRLELANRPGGGFEARIALPVEPGGPAPRAEHAPELVP